MIEIFKRIIFSADASKELYYITTKDNIKVYSLLHVSIFTLKDPSSTRRCRVFGITIPFVSLKIGWIFIK